MTLQKGKILKISGLEGLDTSREDMKTLFEGQGVSWVTFNKGDPEAFIRLITSGPFVSVRLSVRLSL